MKKRDSMSKIKELLRDKNSILVFDVDGVLAILEFGERNHYYATDEEWDKLVDEGANYYTEDKVSKKMQEFLKTRDMNKIYVITQIGVNKEGEYKKQFVHKYYNILEDHVYFVNRNKEKAKEVIEIRNMHPEVEDEKIIMIDDTPEILCDVQDHTNYSTAHISSFLDL